MLPKIIVIDPSGPDEGADIKAKYLVVKEENYEKVYFALTTLTGLEFQTFTKEEYLECLQLLPAANLKDGVFNS